MGLFKQKNWYAPLTMPRLGLMPLPDVRAMKDAGVVQEIMRHAVANLSNLQGDVSTVAPSVALLERSLLRAFCGDDQEMFEGMMPGLLTAVRVGYVVAVMENGGGVAKQAQVEAHYWTALVMLWAQTPDGTKTFADAVHYGFFAGYYVGRAGELSIGPLIEGLRSQLSSRAA